MKEKKALIFLAVLLTVSSVCGSAVCADIKSPVKWSVEEVDMHSRGDSVSIRLSYSFHNSHVASRSAYVLQPRISDGSHMILLRPVTIYHAESGDRITKVRSGNLPASGVENELKLISGQIDDIVTVEDILPREEWMNVCNISVLTSEWSWKDRCRTDRLLEVAGVTYPDHISFKCELSPVEPNETTDRTMEYSFPLYLEYAAGSQAVIPSVGNNNRALMLFRADISSLLDDPRVSLKSLRIDSRTSPEGSTENNNKSARSRISSLRQYLSASGFSCLDSAEFITYGEDWNGMTEWLKKTYYWDTASLDTLFANHSDRDRIKKILKRQHPEIYSDLTGYCFPELDRFICTIDYSVCELISDEQIWDAFNRDVRLLYPHDFWVIARRFPYDTDPWRNIFLSGAERFPQDIYSNMNAAVALIRMGKYNDAYLYIRKCLTCEHIDSRAEEYLQYIQGIIQMYAGDPYYGCRLLERFNGSEGYMKSAYDSARRVIRSLENDISWVVSLEPMQTSN